MADHQNCPLPKLSKTVPDTFTFHDGEMSRFGQWLGLTHTQRCNSHYHTTGEGHLYQSRYKSFPVQSDEHFLSVCRYVERNAYSAELCDSPELWRYGSLWRWRHRTARDKSLLSPWPIDLIGSSVSASH